MEYSILGKSGIKVSKVCLGGWAPFGYMASSAEAFEKAVAVGLERGINFIDTAEEYGQGRSEELIGRILKNLGNRDALIIGSKFCEYNSRPEDIRRSLEGTLRRLGTDYLDIYFQHWPSQSTPLQETIDELSELRKKGLIRAIGVSNWCEREFNEISNPEVIDVLQACHSLAWRVLESKTFPLCQNKKISVIAYSPLAQGLLSGAYSTWRDVPKDSRERNCLVNEKSMYQIAELLQSIGEYGRMTGRSAAQIAMRWVLDCAGNAGIISGARNSEQLREVVDIMNWSLPDEIKMKLDRVSMEISAELTDTSSLWNNHPRAMKAAKNR